MAIEFQTATTQALEGSVGSGNITKPSGTVDGDFLVAGYYFEQGASPSNPTISGTWTQIASVDGNPSFDGILRTWYRRASSEPASYTFTSNGSYGDSAVAFMLRYTGVLSSGNPIRTSATTAPAVQTSPQSGPNLAGLSSTDLVIQLVGVNHNNWDGSAITVTSPGGSWTERANLSNSSSVTSEPTIAVVDQFNQGTGPSWSASSTGDFGFARIGFALIEEPSPELNAKSLIVKQQSINRAHLW